MALRTACSSTGPPRGAAPCGFRTARSRSRPAPKRYRAADVASPLPPRAGEARRGLRVPAARAQAAAGGALPFERPRVAVAMVGAPPPSACVRGSTQLGPARAGAGQRLARARARGRSRCAAASSPPTTARSTSRSGPTSTASAREGARALRLAPDRAADSRRPRSANLLAGWRHAVHLRGPARPSASLGAVAASVEVFGWMGRHPDTRLSRALARPGHELQRRLATERADGGAARGRRGGAAGVPPARGGRVSARAARGRDDGRLDPRSSISPSRRCGRATTRDAYFNHTRAALSARRAPPARRDAGVPAEARRARRDGRGDRDPQALLGRLGGAHRARALRRRRRSSRGRP